MTTPTGHEPLPADAAEVVAALGLTPHPEGGWYAERWRSPAPDGARAACTTIHYLLAEGERSHWHRVDADEVWCHHAGAPLSLRISSDGTETTEHRLGGDPVGGLLEPHAVVPAGHWQAAASTGSWSLVSCVVAPGFDFAGFELAPPGWEPGGRPPMPA